MYWIYLIHEFHNLSWITEINELFHNIIIYWDAPVNNKLSLTFFIEITWIPALLQAIFSACELGVFDLLLQSQKPMSAVEVTQKLGTSEDGIERLLDVLVAIEIVDVEMSQGTGELLNYLYSSTNNWKLPWLFYYVKVINVNICLFPKSPISCV